MINLDITSNEVCVYHSSTPISINSINDVVIKVKNEYDFQNPNKPWNFLFRTFDFRCTGFNEENTVSFMTKEYNHEIISSTSNGVGSLAILQNGEIDSIAFLSRCYLSRYRATKENLEINYSADKAEMIYDR